MKKGYNDELAIRIYQAFCEEEGGVNHPLTEAWDKCEEVYGLILTGSPIDELFIQTIRYVIDLLLIDDEENIAHSQNPK